MDISSLLEVIDVEKFTASIVADLVDGNLLDTLYFALKPSILKAIKAAAE